MSKNLIEAEVSTPDNNKPDGLPDKYWDNEKQEILLQNLITDFNDMASRDENLIETSLRGVPVSFDKYEIQIPSPYLERDDDVLRRMHEKKFTNEQAQLVYDLANEKVLPVLGELTVNFEAQKQIEKLISHFGGVERFNEISRQISTWAKQNLQPEVYDALATTSEGVLALHKMMSSNEPVLSREGSEIANLNEATLRKMMEDPRYWRDKDAEYISRITKGFQKLYPEK